MMVASNAHLTTALVKQLISDNTSNYKLTKRVSLPISVSVRHHRLIMYNKLINNKPFSHDSLANRIHFAVLCLLGVILSQKNIQSL